MFYNIYYFWDILICVTPFSAIMIFVYNFNFLRLIIYLMTFICKLYSTILRASFIYWFLKRLISQIPCMSNKSQVFLKQLALLVTNLNRQQIKDFIYYLNITSYWFSKSNSNRFPYYIQALMDNFFYILIKTLQAIVFWLTVDSTSRRCFDKKISHELPKWKCIIFHLPIKLVFEHGFSSLFCIIIYIKFSFYEYFTGLQYAQVTVNATGPLN